MNKRWIFFFKLNKNHLRLPQQKAEIPFKFAVSEESTQMCGSGDDTPCTCCFLLISMYWKEEAGATPPPFGGFWVLQLKHCLAE